MHTNVATSPFKPLSRGSWILLAVLLGGFLAWGAVRNASQKPEVPYTTAYSWIEGGKVSEVVIKGDIMAGKLKAGEQVEGRSTDVFVTRKPDDSDLVPLLRDKGVVTRVESPEAPLALQILAVPLDLDPRRLVVAVAPRAVDDGVRGTVRCVPAPR